MNRPSRNHQRLTTTACALIVLGTIACDQPPPPESAAAAPPARSLSLVTRLTLPTGNRVDFLQAADNPIVVIEQGRYPRARTTLDLPAAQGSAVDIYRALAGTRAVPTTLLAAAEREATGLRRAKATPAPAQSEVEVRQLALGGGNSTGVAPDSEDGAADQLCPEAWFRDNFCFGGDWQFCFARRTADWNWGRRKVGWAGFGACSYRGAIALNVFQQTCGFLGLICDTWDHTQPLAAGEWAHSLRTQAAGASFTVGMSLSGGSSGYHVAGQGGNP